MNPLLDPPLDVFVKALADSLFCCYLRWFAKRFLHPDVVAEYAYIFLWDEDLGVENFNAGR